MTSKRFTIINLVLTSVSCTSIGIILFSQINQNKTNNTSVPKTIQVKTIPSCETESFRLNGYKYIKPILYNYNKCESKKYQELKGRISGIIQQYQKSGSLDKASVYLKLLSDRDYIVVNEKELFHPASLFKLPVLITLLEMEEKNPGTLNKKLMFHLPKGGLPQQTYNTNQIEAEKSYSIKELLKYMISYSDNNATYLLNNFVDLKLFKKMFLDLGLVVPDIHDINFEISAKDYSVFFNIIYNAGYLSIKNSAFASELLSKCDFIEGIQNGIPINTKIIHKFGEWGDRNNPALHQLSESGIIYLDKTPYILTIMTQGKEVEKLPSVISEISKMVYTYIKPDNLN
ncbi:MAG: class A beta-lactamase-related serine hydrolase [Flavobacteriia bacterium]|nr:class A beta-lactamase-related serine hydrolase [Flavobacteriia bacterium]